MSEKGSRGINQPPQRGIGKRTDTGSGTEGPDHAAQTGHVLRGEAGLEPVLGEVVDVAIASAKARGCGIFGP